MMMYKDEAHSHMEFQVLTPKNPPATELGTSPDTGQPGQRGEKGAVVTEGSTNKKTHFFLSSEESFLVFI